MIRAFIFLLSWLAFVHVRAQTDARTDSLLTQLDSTRIDTVQMGLLLELQEAITGSEMAGPLNDRLGRLCAALMNSSDPAVRRAGARGKASYLLNEGNNLAYKLDLAGAVRLFREADAIGERLGLGQTRESAMLGVAMVYSLAKNEAQATKACKAASDMAWARGDTLLVIRLAKRSMSPDDVQARDRALALIDAYAASRPPAERIRIRWQKAGLWARTHNYKEAITMALASRAMLEAPDAPPYLAPAYYLTLGDCYRHADSLFQATEAYQKCLDIGEAVDAWSWSCSCGDSLGDVWLAIGDRKKAAITYERVLRAAQANSFTGDIAYASKALIAIYRDQGREAEAWAMQDIWTRARDSLDVTEGNAEIASMELRKQMLADSLAHEAEQDRLRSQGLADVSRERGSRNIFLIGGVAVLLLAVALWWRLRYTRKAKSAVEKAHARSEGILLNILPEEVAEELKSTGRAEARHFDQVTILFTDFQQFTSVSEQLSPQELVQELNVCFQEFDRIITARGIEKIKTIGDAYMCAGGSLGPRSSTAADVVQAALELQAFMKHRKAEREAQSRPAFTMRAGIHTGPVVAGIVGVKKFQYDMWGDTVNVASRMESSGEVGQVNISEATYELVMNEAGLMFTPRGKVQAKGKGEMTMYFVHRSAEG